MMEIVAVALGLIQELLPLVFLPSPLHSQGHIQQSMGIVQVILLPYQFLPVLLLGDQENLNQPRKMQKIKFYQIGNF